MTAPYNGFQRTTWDETPEPATVAPAAAPTPTGAPAHGSEASLVDHANRIATEEERRYNEGLAGARSAFDQSQSALSNLIEPGALFSQATDNIGARGRQSIEGLRSAFGARGINPNSGAGQGMMERMSFENTNQVLGATRDSAFEAQRQRQVAAAVNFANAMNVNQATNAPVSGVRYEAEQDIFQGGLTREGIAAMAAARRGGSSGKGGKLVLIALAIQNIPGL